MRGVATWRHKWNLSLCGSLWLFGIMGNVLFIYDHYYFSFLFSSIIDLLIKRVIFGIRWAVFLGLCGIWFRWPVRINWLDSCLWFGSFQWHNMNYDKEKGFCLRIVFIKFISCFNLERSMESNIPFHKPSTIRWWNCVNNIIHSLIIKDEIDAGTNLV